MASLQSYLKRSLELPPDVVLRKAAARAARAWRRTLQRRRDRDSPSYGSDARSASLNGCLGAPDASLLAPHADLLAALAAHYLAHRFDLLGSGWVAVRHGASCRGLEGRRFPAGPAIAPDRAGRWLEGRVNRANLDEAKRVWALVDEGYAPLDWQLDFKSGYRWSESSWYLDIDPYGAPRGADIKVPWELARCQHLPQLALACAAAPGERAAEIAREFRNQILDFVATNPPRFGVNWACAMEVALRVASWLVALDLFRAGGVAFDAAFEAVLARSVREHARHVAENLEWSERQRGNHYLADVCGLLYAAAYLPPDAETDAWLAFAIQELVAETGTQFDPEGANFEASTCYHRFAAELVAYATALALALPADRVRGLRSVAPRVFSDGPRLAGAPPLAQDERGNPRIELPAWFAERLERMAEFTMHCARGDGSVPQIGDNDNGRFLRLPGSYELITVKEAIARYRSLDGYEGLPPERVFPDERVNDHRGLLAALAGLVDRDDLARLAAGHAIEAALVRGLARARLPAGAAPRNAAAHATIGAPDAHAAAREQIRALPERQRQRYEFRHAPGGLLTDLQALAYPTFGLYVLRSPLFHLAIRCGALDRRAGGAHAHNDQLAIDLELAGEPRVADPGAYLYTPLPELRDRYRSAAAHFAPRLPGREPNRLDRGMFAMTDTTRARCLYFGRLGFAGMHVGFGEPVLRVVLLRDDAVIVEDGALGGPLEPLVPSGTLPASPKYGALLR